MHNSVFTEKRTRSQLTLPDELLSQLSQRSPLKDARTALRNNNHVYGEPSMDLRVEATEESDDELLLSPGKVQPTARTTKRSVSPPPGGEYAVRPDSPSKGRELKRLKRDDDGDPTPDSESHIKNSAPRSTHTRSLSQPEPGKKSSRARSGTNPGSGTPSPSKPDSDTSAPSGKGRAQSVPLFPSSSSSSIAHIDLRNPPPSPRRPRSRSPSKEREFRIVSGPSAITKLDTIPDEGGLEMNVDEGTKSLLPLVSGTPEISSPNVMSNGTLAESMSPEQSRPASPTQTLSVPVIYEPPSTPASQRPIMPPLSPLTPLPETPHPSKVTSSTANRYTGIGWGTNLEEKDEDQVSTLAPVPSNPLPALGATPRSRLPRPSSSVNITSSITGAQPASFSMITTKHTTQMGPPLAVPAANKPLLPGPSKPATVPAKPNDAFAVLMANARENNEKGKGKGKAKALLIKAGSSSGAAAKSASSSSKLTQKGKANDKGKEREAQPSKISIKSQMKPKGKPKPKPIPVPVAPLDSEVVHPPSSQSPSPVNTPRLSRPSTPPIMDVSMESIDPAMMVEDKPSDAPEILPPTGSIVPHSIEDLTLLEAVPEPPQEAGVRPSSPTPVNIVESNDFNAIDVPSAPAVDHLGGQPPSVPIATDPTATDATMPTYIEPIITEPTTTQTEPITTQTTTTEPIKAKSATTKLHISKRMPVSVTPVDRVTRSVSSRRNQKTPEVPKSLPRKASGKQALARKKSIPSIAPVASGPSSQAADLTPLDASTSSLSDLSTDPAELAEPPGSPMKLGSPAKKIKAPETSFIRPTQSTAARTSLSRSPVKRTPVKSATPSPSKLTRSVSMFSRPTGRLSRSFTGYSSLAGSSLSTLSDALEKLHQPPPGRPNTSMGFNRDDADSGFALKTMSKDDTSIGPPNSNDSHKGASPPSEAIPAVSRLVQRTLISGPRPSVTGKSIFGTGTMMRGTGGFKVPGNPVKPSARIFGVGGGGGAAKTRTTLKASRKTSLPSVMASPVKGGDKEEEDAMDVADDEDMGQKAGTSRIVPSVMSVDQQVALNDTGKGKERSTDSWKFNASRRVSLVSQALSQSLNAPESSGLGLMGPPATPTDRMGMRSTSSTYPASQASTSSGGEVSERVSPSTRSLTMSLRNAPSAIQNGARGSKVTMATAGASHVQEALKVLKDCVIFVDVRTDDGDEAGSLFVEMLEGVGARLLTRVGQTCTHIVYKNGLMSTLTRYRLLRDPKPLVVGIAWVVECVEQRKQVDETKFLIDLDGMNVSGTNKRRRSMLPKLIYRERDEKSSSDVEGDVSMDGSTSLMALDDDLTPLEKARRRKGLTLTR